MNELLDLCVWYMSSIWSFFTDINVPGTDLSIASIFVGILFISIAFGILSLVVGFPIGATSVTQSYGSKGSKKVKVSDVRKNDDK